MLKRKVMLIIKKIFIEDGAFHYIKVVFDFILFQLLYKYAYKKCFLYYGNNVRWGKHGHFRLIPNTVRISGSEQIHISDNVQIDEGVYLQAHPNGDGIFLGKSVRINAFSHVQGYSKICIEECTLIAPYTHINSGNHAVAEKGKPIMFQKHIASERISIGKGSWLGHSSTILGGAIIPPYSVVGANTVVTKQYKERCIVIGSPSRVILIK
jgi:acetyltransferase-like isoleucine patch superfamily enzyme